MITDYLEQKQILRWGLLDPHQLQIDKFKKPEDDMIFNKYLFKYVKKSDYQRNLQLAELDRQKLELEIKK